MGNRRAAIADTKTMTKSLNNKKYDKELFTPGSWFFEESNIGQKCSNQYQGRSNNYPGINISNINHDFLINNLARQKQLVNARSIAVSN